MVESKSRNDHEPGQKQCRAWPRGGTALHEVRHRNHPKAGRVYAFEVDAFGNYYCTDDGKSRTCLSLPYLGP